LLGIWALPEQKTPRSETGASNLKNGFVLFAAFFAGTALAALFGGCGRRFGRGIVRGVFLRFVRHCCSPVKNCAYDHKHLILI